MPYRTPAGYESSVCFRLRRCPGRERLALPAETILHRRAGHQDPRNTQVTFDLEACRFQLSARRVIQFPPGMAGNVLRGALGSALREVASAEDYARIFEPAGDGPSGLYNRPRPFVIRCAALNGRILQPGDRFCFDLHLFDATDPPLDHFTKAFAQWADLISVEHQSITVDLGAQPNPASRIRVQFQTPTELKAASGDAIDFAVLLARARDRVSTLRSLYGAGSLEIDFRGLAQRARAVKTLRSELHPVIVERRSSR